MGSSNLVSVVYQEESAYGVRDEPSAGSVMHTAILTSEGLSGTPDTTESTTLRSDRMSAGQVVTGLTVGGPLNFELASDKFFDDFFRFGMMSDWVAEETINTTVDLVPDGTDNQKAVLTLGAEFVNLVPGTMCRFTPTGGDPINVQITSVDTPSTVFTVATMRDEIAVSETLDVSIPSYLDIGALQQSAHVGKSYLDLQHLETTDNHSQTYGGMLVSGFTVEANTSEIVTGNFETSGNSYLQEAPSLEQLVVAAGGTVNPQGTANPINSSIDIGLVTSDDVATDYCIQSLSITLDNGLSEQLCLGKAAPQRYDLGTAAVTVSMSLYNTDPAYDFFMPSKITQEPVSITYVAENQDGGYIFHIEAMQLSFPDPAATGQNEQTFIEAEGVGKVGENGASTIRIYKV